MSDKLPRLDYRLSLIHIFSYIQSYFPPERSKRILGRFHGIWANIVSALLGTCLLYTSRCV